MKTRKFLFLLLSAVILLTVSCEKEAGEGGTSKIVGKVYVYEYNYNYTDVIGEHWGQEEDVYIVYGDDSIYSDRFETNYDGSFKFEYLRKGKYTIYVYSDDTLSLYPNGDVIESREVEITENGQVITLDDIIIHKN